MQTKVPAVFLSGLVAGLVFVGAAGVPRAHATSLAQQIICLEFGINNHIIGSIVTLNTDYCPGGTSTSTQPVLTVIKQINGGDASPGDFTMQVSGSNVSEPSFPGSSSGTLVTLDAGSYTVSESGGPAGYTPSFSGDCNETGSGTIADNETQTCTVTNTYSAPPPPPSQGVLEVKKVIVGGPDSNPQDFSFEVTGSTDGTGSPIAFGPGGTNDMTVGTDQSYSVAEVATSSYTTTYSNSENENADCAGLSIVENATTTCTVTNTYNSSGGGTADIAVTKSVDNDAPNTGDTVTYTITVSDTGADAAGVVVHDALPSGLTFVSTSSADTVGVYDSSTGDWTIGDIAGGASVTLHLMATVNGGLEDGTVITNTAAVTSGDTSDDSENDSGSASLTVTIPGNNPGPSTPSGGGGGGGGGVIGGPLSVGYQGGGVVLGTSTQAATCGPLLTKFLRQSFGSKNDPSEVKKLQQFLDNQMNAGLPVNGIFGSQTDQAVRNFQQKYAADVLTPWGLSAPTGFVYLTTQRWVNLLYCQSLTIPIPPLIPYGGH